MNTELLVLQFVEDGKLTVEDAVQLLETLALEGEQEELQDSSPNPLMVWIIQPPSGA